MLQNIIYAIYANIIYAILRTAALLFVFTKKNIAGVKKGSHQMDFLTASLTSTKLPKEHTLTPKDTHILLVWLQIN
jgi:hypothetical protein